MTVKNPTWHFLMAVKNPTWHCPHPSLMTIMDETVTREIFLGYQYKFGVFGDSGENFKILVGFSLIEIHVCNKDYSVLPTNAYVDPLIKSLE